MLSRLGLSLIVAVGAWCCLARCAVAQQAAQTNGAEPPASRPAPPTPEQARKSFWSFQPVTRPPVPEVKDNAWVRNPIDAFVLAKLKAKGLHPAPPADRITLLRRATYDLIGLPPTPAEVEAFLADESPDAYDKRVDRLLDSPHYGEKWGRYWLDLVRYAESNSYERDNPKPNVWRYRDYVIRSFNEDKPYDQFVKEQLAGDEMPESGSDDRLIATGFYRLGIWDDEPTDRLQARYDNLDDVVTTTGQVFLGLTVDCARCHNHKIDPIPQTDYYRLLAFFQNITPYENGGSGDLAEIYTEPGEREAVQARREEKRKKDVEAHARVAEIEKEFLVALKRGLGPGDSRSDQDLLRRIFPDGQRLLGKERFEEYVKLKFRTPRPNGQFALSVSESGPEAPETYVCLRGNANAPGEIVQPGFPKVLADGDATIPAPAADATTCGRRTVLADWITSKQNPLFARVMANRIFQYHFGRGIVRSPNNFGIQGDKPTHPELLDWLASEFEANGLKLKRMHRLIMTSNAYQMSCKADATALAADPQNDWLWRFDLRRLTAEEIRDSVLATDGTLNLKMYGPSIYPDIPAAVKAGQSMPGANWPTSKLEEAVRRSVYIHVKRSLQVPILQAFDSAETDRSCPVRFVTVQPTQALGMLNGSFLNEQAAKLAARLKREAGDDPARQVILAFRLATCRAPTARELQRSLDLMQSLQSRDGASSEQARKYFCLMVLNLSEFMYVD